MKKGTKKVFIYFVMFAAILMLSGVFAETIGLNDSVKKVVNGILENKGIDKDKINSVKEVGFDNLPKQIDVENIDQTNLAVYEVDYGGEKPIFVITASNEMFEATENPGIYRAILDFGLAAESSESTFLETVQGVRTSPVKGYVMLRGGSVTGLSTNLEIVSGEGNIDVVVYINGKPSSFSNTFTGESGVKKDYDTQSMDIINFEKGDVISVYIKSDGNIVYKDIINLVEISTKF